MFNEIEILKDLVSFNTIEDKENKKIINYIEKILSNMEFKLEKKDKYLIMSFGSNIKLGFVGHSDTVDITDNWQTNPFQLTIKENILYGLGSCDMKGGIAAFLTALYEVNLSQIRNGIRVYITYDEEKSFSGIKDIIEFQKANGLNFPEYNIIGEPTDNVAMTGCKGLLAVKLKTNGIKVHSSTPNKGKSANLSMIKLLNELQEFYNTNIKENVNNIYDIPYTTMNIGLIEGGNSINSVSDKCNSYIDFRIAKEEHINYIKEEIKILCNKYDGEYIIDFEIKPFYEEVEFINKLRTANFMTEASFMNGKRIILGVGPVTAHEIDEHITKESLRKTVEQYKDIIKKVCM